MNQDMLDLAHSLMKISPEIIKSSGSYQIVEICGRVHRLASYVLRESEREEVTITDVMNELKESKEHLRKVESVVATM